MKILYALLLCFLMACSAWGHEQYKQKISVKFESAKDAKEATAKLSMFPDGKKIGCSSRWDDSNPRHLQTAQMLAKHGYKATCYLGEIEDLKILNMARGVLELGGSIGSHTLTHPFLDTLLPAQIFREIALERIVLESALDTNVVAFVLPYTSYSSVFDPNVAKYVGISIINTGYLAEPEPLKPNKINYSLNENQDIISSNVYRADDRNPQEEIFNKTLDAALAQVKSGAEPHITLGIHSWQTDEGLERLGGYIDKRKSHQWWYCNENEYAAYRTQFLNSVVEKKSVNGDCAEFELSRPAATHLGSNIMLEIEFSKNVESVFVDGKKLGHQSNNRSIKIPHDSSCLTPKKIDLISNNGNSKELKISKKFSGISGVLYYDKSKNNISVILKNDGKNELINAQVTFRVPPCYSMKDNLKKLGKITSQSSVKSKFKLESTEYENAFDEGELLLIAQCDFVLDSSPARIYLTTLKKNPAASRDNPRDCALHTQPFEDSLISQDDILKLSSQTGALPKIGNVKWNESTSVSLRKFHLQYNGYGAAAKFPKGNFRQLYCFDTIAKNDGDYRLVCSENTINAIYINGTKFDNLKRTNTIKLKEGLNRVIVEMGDKAMRKRSPAIMILDGEAMLQCQQPVRQ